jgi:dienelactone hydrolase
MSYIMDELKARNIPDVLTFKDGTKLTDKADWEKRRTEMLEIIAENMFGHIPPSYPIETEELKYSDKVLGKKIYYTKLMLKINTPKGQAQFPIYQFLPKDKKNVPMFIHIAFNPEDPWRATPVELLIDRGYGLVMAYYKDITSDDADFENGVAQFFDRADTSKISLWAWGMKHVMDYVQTLDVVDKKKIAMIGHSRLGKTALLAAALDKRFAVAHSNCSVCSGDSLNRGKHPKSETIGDILDRFEFWFCKNYESFRNKDNETPFDQHFMQSLIAPRRVHIASAQEDIWAGPENQFLCSVAASEVFELYGKKGLVYGEGDFLNPDKYLNDGSIGFCFRRGKHYFSRDDWHGLMDFMNK